MVNYLIFTIYYLVFLICKYCLVWCKDRIYFSLFQVEMGKKGYYSLYFVEIAPIFANKK